MIVGVDVIDFLNDVTGGELLAWKVVFASFVFLLAGMQVLFAAGLYGKLNVAGGSDSAARLHRWSGRLALFLALLVAFSCLIGPAGPTEPSRVLLHSIFGSLVFALLAAKFIVLRLTRAGQQWLPVLGIAAFLTFGAIWATSVADYVSNQT